MGNVSAGTPVMRPATNRGVILKSYIDAMGHYADFSGRMARSQFWIFTLVLTLLWVVLAVLAAVVAAPNTAEASSASGSPLTLVLGLVALAHVIPSLAAIVRRLHDSDKSGWWVLLNLVPAGGIVVLVLCCQASTPGANRFGPNPANASSGTLATPVTPSPAVPPSSPTQLPSMPVIPSPLTSAHVDQLEKLAALRTSGAIDEDEFKEMKARVLGTPQAQRT